MKSICYLLALFILNLHYTSYAQVKDPKQFSGWDKKIIFEDNFNDDHNNWLTDNSVAKAAKDEDVETKATITQGYLTYEVVKGDKPYAAAIERDIDYNRDFEIEYCFKIIAADKRYKAASAFFWGRDTSNSSCFLYFSKVGGVDFVNCIDPDWKNCDTKHSFSSPLNKNTFNRIYLRKIKDTYYLFINERLEKTYAYEPLKGNKIGLGAGVGASVAYDYIRISYIE